MLCVIAKLPEDASEKLRMLRDSALPAELAGVPLYGHITIATYLPEDDGSFAEACVRTIREYSSFTVRYEKLRVLCRTSIIAALPSMTEELVSLHSRVADQYAGSLDRWTAGKDWLPHTTLFYDPAADLQALCRKMQQQFDPFEARISRIELSQVREDGYTIRDVIRLR